MVNKPTPQERLLLYEHAIIMYTLSLYLPFLKWLFGTTEGLCYFLEPPLSWLPDLVAAAPDPDSYYRGFWFPPGEIAPRLACLKRAREILFEAYAEDGDIEFL